MKTLRIALAQINPTVGDLRGNTEKIIEYIEKARTSGADIIAFPELSITGYPPEDLLLNTSFLKDNMICLKKIVPHTKGITSIVGFVDARDNIYNGAAIISNNKLIDVYHKVNFIRSSIFDEFKYFQKGEGYPLYNLDGVYFSISIGDDILHLKAHPGTKFIINIDTSPYYIGGNIQKEKSASQKAYENHAVLACVNMVGGQDEVVFNGESFIINEEGEIISRGAPFEEDLVVADLMYKQTNKASIDRKTKTINISFQLKQKKKAVQERMTKRLKPLEEIYKVLVLGVKDYVRKNGFKRVVLGLSGGIDSSLVALIAKDAIGKDSVTGIFMPSQYTSIESKEDAYQLAKNLNIKIIETPIAPLFRTYMNLFKTHFKNLPVDTTEENIQPRIRANILMAFSNKLGWLVLNSGNKSEIGTGYSTLYGDTAGGFAVLKDVSKTFVYKLAMWRNKKERYPLMPERVFKKAPSAELKPDQKDTDTLPPYKILDPILTAYIEDNRTIDELSAMGYDTRLVKEIMGMVDQSEYKRRQSPIGIKITKKSFGKDRTFPITNKYKHKL
jgi:NAD+ synthase (glutamine-hydrolysing)